MLLRAHFENYRCLKNVTIEFGPLTVLVGPNGSGKSSVLRGLLIEEFMHPSDVWQHSSTLSATVTLTMNGGSKVAKTCRASVPPSLARNPYSSQLLHLDLAGLREANTTQAAPRLDPRGTNLANAFGTLTRTEQGKLAAQFAQLIPTFADVNARPHNSGRQHLLFQDRWNPDVWYTADQVSDGTMLVLAYLIVQHQRPQVDLILIEEPERGLHPYLLGSLTSLLRKLSKGEIGPRPVQVVLATHSADLLDHLEPQEVRFLTRDSADGSVRVDTVPTGTEAWQEAYRTYDESLGALWKSGGLRGVPGG